MNEKREEIEKCISTLESLLQDSALAELPTEQRIALLKAAGAISRPDRAEAKRRNKAASKAQYLTTFQKNRCARNTTGIRTARLDVTFTAPAQIALSSPESGQQKSQELDSPRNCYICKKEFTRLHFFYDTMCTECGDLNYRKRFQTADLGGHVALITGARLKIGYQAALQMLRAGATVVVTTRFPIDAAIRYSGEEDYAVWQDRLRIHGLDLRHIPSVEIFAGYIERKYGRLDILINNAAQTVKRPAAFYAHLIENENKGYSVLSQSAQKLLGDHETLKKQLGSLRSISHKGVALADAWHDDGPGIGLRASAQLSQIAYRHDNSLVSESLFPKGQLDADLQQVDLRKTNSWRLYLGEIDTTEMIEVQLVNAVAPFVLCNTFSPEHVLQAIGALFSSDS
ncbi:MAG TPA: SDR family oxidoreductase, partial [Syntrophorhabdaceae bacterium]|nr:SDR family oxidoreductase [Syntrophorhabdaceae bacterium]